MQDIEAGQSALIIKCINEESDSISLFGIPFSYKDLEPEAQTPLDYLRKEKKARNMIGVSSSPTEPRY